MVSTRLPAAKTMKQTAAQAANPPTITIPNLSSMFTPIRFVNNANTMKASGDCNCGCCEQRSTTVCLTFDTSLLQSLVNMFPKIQVTNNVTTCDDEEEEEENEK